MYTLYNCGFEPAPGTGLHVLLAALRLGIVFRLQLNITEIASSAEECHLHRECFMQNQSHSPNSTAVSCRFAPQIVAQGLRESVLPTLPFP
jgi:hypothetical protein